MAFKCSICKKKFETISAVREHHRAVHPNARFVAPSRERITRRFLIILLATMIVTASAVGYLIYAQASQTTTVSIQPGGLSSPISAALYQSITGVNSSTLSAIGVNETGTTPPTDIASPTAIQPLSDNKPEIFYIGAEWCPYCAAERWALIGALSQFGNFSGIEYMQSAADEGSIATLSLRNITFTSKYISFLAVETQDRNHNTLQTPNPEEQDLWSSYTSQHLTIPFIYIYGVYFVSGSQFSFDSLAGLNWTQIASQLNNPTSSIAKLIDGASNELVGAICAALKSKSWSVPPACGASYAQVAFTQRANQGTSPSSAAGGVFSVVGLKSEPRKWQVPFCI